MSFLDLPGYLQLIRVTLDVRFPITYFCDYVADHCSHILMFHTFSCFPVHIFSCSHILMFNKSMGRVHNQSSNATASTNKIQLTHNDIQTQG